jgi:hypothetical protein
VVYACLAETIVLALEGKYEIFTVGREIEWEKVREIYKMGLKARHEAGCHLRCQRRVQQMKTSRKSENWPLRPGKNLEPGKSTSGSVNTNPSAADTESGEQVVKTIINISLRTGK